MFCSGCKREILIRQCQVIVGKQYLRLFPIFAFSHNCSAIVKSRIAKIFLACILTLCCNLSAYFPLPGDTTMNVERPREYIQNPKVCGNISTTLYSPAKLRVAFLIKLHLRFSTLFPASQSYRQLYAH